MVPNKFLMKKETAKNHFKYALTTDPSASVRNGYFIANESTTMEQVCFDGYLITTNIIPNTLNFVVF